MYNFIIGRSNNPPGTQGFTVFNFRLQVDLGPSKGGPNGQRGSYSSRIGGRALELTPIRFAYCSYNEESVLSCTGLFFEDVFCVFLPPCLQFGNTSCEMFPNDCTTLKNGGTVGTSATLDICSRRDLRTNPS